MSLATSGCHHWTNEGLSNVWLINGFIHGGTALTHLDVKIIDPENFYRKLIHRMIWAPGRLMLTERIWLFRQLNISTAQSQFSSWRHFNDLLARLTAMTKYDWPITQKSLLNLQKIILDNDVLVRPQFLMTNYQCGWICRPYVEEADDLPPTT